ncbi:MAG: 2-C-methyl-D-erythritol 4-phosphate cytidylyltransferase [Bacteroidales bacterium]|nr:2-C-methyl-D-erythritol 4-phosphate cytidylyltransferase [Bacteroidales bacterium]MBR0297701.1 2-C-methyl-D-erythritol 4-phosphate cytidylyltransferase [Bacteroidales bacterium]
MERPVYFIVSAGGSGTRMGAGKPKQFLSIGGKSILHLTIEALHEAAPEARFVTVLPKEHLPYWKQYCLEHNLTVPQILVEGGLTRFHSVKAALEKVPDGAIVAIHDGVRPFISATLVNEMLQKMEEGCRGLVPCLPATDTFKVLCRGEGPLLELVPGAAPVDRQTLFSVQTPQMFLSEEIKLAYSAAYNVSYTDDSSVAAASGIPVQFIPGDKFNIKITTPEDLVLAGAIKADIENEN